MKKYKVTVREVWSNVVEVEAESPDEAIAKVAEDIEEGQTSYEYTLEPDEWTVTNVDETIQYRSKGYSSGNSLE